MKSIFISLCFAALLAILCENPLLRSSNKWRVMFYADIGVCYCSPSITNHFTYEGNNVESKKLNSSLLREKDPGICQEIGLVSSSDTTCESWSSGGHSGPGDCEAKDFVAKSIHAFDGTCKLYPKSGCVGKAMRISGHGWSCLESNTAAGVHFASFSCQFASYM
ncbi:hypothetical protein F4677DRAFT_450245 [Hypoxylon crocopeplum]|nr:hypothetical protein F4677DRAFT_450245 [Hypoxylon crocopeplum]